MGIFNQNIQSCEKKITKSILPDLLNKFDFFRGYRYNPSVRLPQYKFGQHFYEYCENSTADGIRYEHRSHLMVLCTWIRSGIQYGRPGEEGYWREAPIYEDTKYKTTIKTTGEFERNFELLKSIAEQNQMH